MMSPSSDGCVDLALACSMDIDSVEFSAFIKPSELLHLMQSKFMGTLTMYVPLFEKIMLSVLCTSDGIIMVLWDKNGRLIRFLLFPDNVVAWQFEICVA